VAVRMPTWGSMRLEFLRAVVRRLTRVGRPWRPRYVPSDKVLVGFDGDGRHGAWTQTGGTGDRPPGQMGCGAPATAQGRYWRRGIDRRTQAPGVGPSDRCGCGKHRMPTVYAFREGVEAGYLMSYGPHVPDLDRQIGRMAARILRGARPQDLPFEQPRHVYLIINLKTAKALGLTI